MFLLALNLYWTSQVLRLVLVVVIVGTVTHWFANSYQDEEGGEGDEEAGPLSEGRGVPSAAAQQSPLLYDGDLLPPLESETPGGEGQPEASLVMNNEESTRIVLHFARSGLTTSLGTVCRGALACLPVRLAEGALRLASTTPHLEFFLCAGWCDYVVRLHHELLLVHVASYAKSFTSAARDVWLLIDESGLAVVQEDDVAAKVLRALGLGLSGAVVTALSLLSPCDGLLTLLCLWLGYCACSQALQVVDSAVAAIYLVFAEHPTALRAHFPLVHHRFARIAEFSSYHCET